MDQFFWGLGARARYALQAGLRNFARLTPVVAASSSLREMQLFGRFRGRSGHSADTPNRSFMTRSGHLPLSIDASRKVHSITSWARASRAHVLRRHHPGIVTKHIKPATEMMRTDTSLHADQARRHVGKPRFHLATRPLLTQRNCTALIETHDVEQVLADIDGPSHYRTRAAYLGNIKPNVTGRCQY